MSNFQSIDDLIPKKDDASEKVGGQVAQETEVQEKFTKKMEDISFKELESQAEQLAGSLGFSYINLEKFPVSQEALRQIPETQSKELEVVCFFFSQDEVRLGAVDPNKPEVQELLHQIQERNHANGALYTISKQSFGKVFELYKKVPVIAAITKNVEISEEDLEKVQADVNDFASLQKLFDSEKATDIVTFIMGAGLKLGSSDVHVEAEEQKVIIRFRMDGILHEAGTISKEMYKKLISRIKLLSSLKINITDQPQDGRFTIKTKNGAVDIRVSTIPTVYGESLVMRLLPQSKEKLMFEDLGLRGSAYKRLKAEIERPNGMIITTGPTGSGKTTTLYSIMQYLNKPGVKIITLEDPVEYRMEGINQSQMDASKGYTFASALRSVLRQDPDIAMVGEIRDLETAEVAIQAALTGHLMLSTIHTNSASGAIPRFLSMGVKAFLMAPALNCVIGQRLVRKLCDCKVEIELTPEQKEKVVKFLENLPEGEKTPEMGEKFYGPGKCEKCSNLGYKGRLGIYEIFIMIPEIEQLIVTGNVGESDIEQIAVKNGMVTMVQDGILKSMEGLTSIDEVFRVIG